MDLNPGKKRSVKDGQTKILLIKISVFRNKNISSWPPKNLMCTIQRQKKTEDHREIINVSQKTGPGEEN